MEAKCDDKMDARRVILLLFMGLNYCIVAMNHALPTFHLYTPSFYCEVDNNNTFHGCLNNISQKLTCEGRYVFEDHDGARTLAEEWLLVCDQRSLLALLSTLYYVGVTVGAVLCGVAADKWGRRPILLISLPTQAIIGACCFFVQSLTILMVLRCMQGFFVQGLQAMTYIYVMESFPSHLRTRLAIILETFWASGLATLAALDFLVMDWRYLQLAIAAPSISVVLIMCWLPETPRWISTHKAELSQENEVSENGYKNVSTVGEKYNCDRESQEKTVASEESVTWTTPETKTWPEKSPECLRPSSRTETKSKWEKGILELFCRPGIRENSFIMLFVWFAVSSLYYGITFYLPSLAGQRHLNFFYGAVLEAVSYVISFCILIHYGCRRPLCTSLLLTGVLFVAVGGMSVVPEEHSNWAEPVHTTLALVGKAMLVSAFCILYLYTSELFPTVLRAAALGMCGLGGRMGSLLAPQITVFGNNVSPAATPVTMGVLALIAGASTLKMPETRGQSLPDTVSDVQMLKNNKTDHERQNIHNTQ